MLSFIHWNVDPEIVKIFVFSIRWYGLLFAASFYGGYYLFTKFFKLEKINIEVLDRGIVYMAVGTILGARLGHCLFYQPDYYLANPIEIFKIWEGGLASHGAGIGIMIAMYLFAKKEKFSFWWLLDRVVIGVALSGFFIRLGNLMNSEIYGVPTSMPWGFIFERDGQTVPMHPTQIYESLSYLLIFVLLYKLYYKFNGKPAIGLLTGLFFTLTFTMRFWIEFVKNPQVDFETNLVLNMGQVLSIPFVAFGLIMLYWVNKGKLKDVKK